MNFESDINNAIQFLFNPFLKLLGFLLDSVKNFIGFVAHKFSAEHKNQVLDYKDRKARQKEAQQGNPEQPAVPQPARQQSVDPQPAKQQPVDPQPAKQQPVDPQPAKQRPVVNAHDIIGDEKKHISEARSKLQDAFDERALIIGRERCVKFYEMFIKNAKDYGGFNGAELGTDDLRLKDMEDKRKNYLEAKENLEKSDVAGIDKTDATKDYHTHAKAYHECLRKVKLESEFILICNKSINYNKLFNACVDAEKKVLNAKNTTERKNALAECEKFKQEYETYKRDINSTFNEKIKRINDIDINLDLTRAESELRQLLGLEKIPEKEQVNPSQGKENIDYEDFGPNYFDLYADDYAYETEKENSAVVESQEVLYAKLGELENKTRQMDIKTQENDATLQTVNEPTEVQNGTPVEDMNLNTIKTSNRSVFGADALVQAASQKTQENLMKQQNPLNKGQHNKGQREQGS